ncbi:TcaA 3rd/4th domain-containing protein [Exiguobacterium flavidum]|uniref:TcaA 3rd/4th domain-containing protein n=1 Tax=Exiguobacterium flavidum TaxID=2184695 RepID=UPI000DF801B3|nr:hypothetical protein [Exiguobacterium flavidum]
MACVQCETAARQNLAFCPGCGKKVEMTAASRQERNTEPGERKSGMSRKKKGMLVTLLLAAGLGAGYFGLAREVFTAEANTNEIRQAIQLSDAKKLAGHLEYDGKTVDEKLARRFLDALKDTPDEKKELLDYLWQAGRSLTAENESGVPGQVVASGRQYGVFQDYRLRLDGMKTTIVSNFEGTKVTLADPVGTETSSPDADGIALTGVYPGLLKAKIDYDGQYGKESADVVINPLALDAPDRMYEIELKGKAVTLDQTYPEATLFVDGENTGETVGNLEAYGPVPKDGITLSIENEFAWGSETSADVLVKPDMKEAKFVFKPSAMTLDQIEDAVAWHASEWVDAAENRSTGYFTLIDDVGYLTQQQQNYDDWYERDREWSGEYLSSSIDPSTAKFVDYGGETAIEVTATTRIRGKFVDYYGDDLSGESTSTSVFRYLFTYGETEDAGPMFRIQQATNIK